VAAVIALLLLAGCTFDSSDPEDEGSPPNKETLEELPAQSESSPVYWLSQSFQELPLSGARQSNPEFGGGEYVTYGKRECQASGCTPFPIEVSNSVSRGAPFLPPTDREHICFQHIRAAVMVSDCRIKENPEHQAATLYGRRGTDLVRGRPSPPSGKRRSAPHSNQRRSHDPQAVAAARADLLLCA
jgi:hypothetical protein